MAQAQSVTTFVMSARLPWPDDAPAADALGALDPVALSLQGSTARPRSAAFRRSARPSAARAARSPGDEVTVELATGQRPAGTIEWVAGGEAGIRFKAADRHARAAQPHTRQPARRTPHHAPRRTQLPRRHQMGRQPRRHDPAQYQRARAAGRRRRPARARTPSSPCSSTAWSSRPAKSYGARAISPASS